MCLRGKPGAQLGLHVSRALAVDVAQRLHAGTKALVRLATLVLSAGAWAEQHSHALRGEARGEASEVPHARRVAADGDDDSTHAMRVVRAHYP